MNRELPESSLLMSVGAISGTPEIKNTKYTTSTQYGVVRSTNFPFILYRILVFCWYSCLAIFCKINFIRIQKYKVATPPIPTAKSLHIATISIHRMCIYFCVVFMLAQFLG